MHVKKIVFDKLESEKDFYTQLVKQEKLKGFGNNLDALFDSLTADIEGPVELVFKNSSSYIAKEHFKRIKAVIEEASDSRDDLHVTYE